MATKVSGKHRPGTAGSAKGRARLRDIRAAALAVLVDEGYSRLTMRRIAAAARITVGNLHYYFANKDDLLRDLLEDVIEGYLREFDDIRARVGGAAATELEAICRYLVEDLGSRQTTLFFPELWALANHDPHAAALLDRLYARARIVLNELIDGLNPSVSTREREVLALIVSAGIEGLTMFVGHGKPWAHERPLVCELAVRGYLDLIRNVRGTRGAAGARAARPRKEIRNP